MTFSPTAEQVQRSLSAHSIIGLTVSALLYMICLTGTLAVFSHALERWATPEIPEFTQYSNTVVESAFQHFLHRAEKSPKSLYITLPSKDLPRMQVSGSGQKWYVTVDGTLSEKVQESWINMLRAMHVRLHLPHSIGLILVSVLGTMQIALIISGLIAHPRIFKDAFRCRLGGSKRLEQADIHNRLSVWGLPFHLMISITGAFYGLVGLLIIVTATSLYDGDGDKITTPLYGEKPSIDAPIQPLDLKTALASFNQIEPTATPLYIAAHNMGTRQQYIEVAAILPGRMVYSERYRFSADGTYINKQGLSDGPLERQWAYSIYRIHFGWFGGIAIKITYTLMGLALTVVCVSGINIWLARRLKNDAIHQIWSAFVWGVPLAFCFSAFCNVILNLPSLACFIVCIFASLVFCLRSKGAWHTRLYLQQALSVSLCLLVIAYNVRFAEHRSEGLVLTTNITLLSIAALVMWFALYRSRQRRIHQNTFA